MPATYCAAELVAPTKRVPVVDPGATFEVELPARLPDARVVLLDAADAHVACRGRRELGVTTRLALAPAAPLVAGSRYALRVEGRSVALARTGEWEFPYRANLDVSGSSIAVEIRR